MAIENLLGLSPPAKSYEWEVTIISPYVADENIKFHAQTATIPGDSSDVMEINYRWYKIQAPGRDASSKEITIEFWESEDLFVYKQLSSWRTAIQDWDSGIQMGKAAVVGTVILDLLSQSGSPIGTWTLINAWVKEISDIELNYDGSDPVRISAIFAFDYCKRPF